MRALLRQDKKGVSLMIGYVLLVVIVISLSVAVFAFLKLYLPPEKPSCPDDVALSFEPECIPGDVKITFTNNGLFSVDGALVRIGDDSNRLVKELLNKNNFAFYNVSGPFPLKPQEDWHQTYDYNYNIPGFRVVEIEPVLFIGGEQILCEKAVVSKSVNCHSN